MTTIFLSYAEEDSVMGSSLARAAAGRGADVYWWEDPERPGERFLDVIPNELYAADRFVALLTPHYLGSPWCRREVELALQVENDRARQFVKVVQPVDTEVERPGWLGGYAAIPVHDGDWASTIDAVLAGVDARLRARPQDRHSAKWTFRNRDQELDLVSGELTTDGGTDVWLLCAPPQLGKSWLLYELADRVTRTVPSCTVRLLNLRDHPASMRGDCARLLATMFDLQSLPTDENVDVGASLGPAVAELSRRGEQQMYLLDNADLLEASAVRDLRVGLARIFELLRSAGWTARIRVVISGRQVDEWRPVPEVRSRKLLLTEFTEDVLHSALADLDPPPTVGADRLVQVARRAHRMCEGLPALLVPILDEISQARFVGMDDALWWQGAYERVVAPYIRDQLLSVDSLFPAGGRELLRARQDLERTLRRLVVYRLVTRSTLGHLQSIPVFGVIRATALFSHVLRDPWDEIYPPIRRLLHRYYYPDPAERLTVETDALAFYRGWARRSAEREQSVIVVQCIWHEAARRATGLTEEGIDTLPAFAAAQANELLDVPRYGAELVAPVTERLLDEDVELQRLLGPGRDLFEAVVTAVRTAIEAMGDD